MHNSESSDFIEEKKLKNKIIPKELHTEVAQALSFFPELLDTPIEFRFKKSIKGSFMQAQPRFSSLFRTRSKREYLINLSPFLIVEDEPIPILDIPNNVLVGWIGHELGHIMDYLHRSSINLIGFGLGYLFSKRFLMGAEQAADIFALEHGLADYIVEAKNYILNHTSLPQDYKDKIKQYYMSPEEVLLFIEGELDMDWFLFKNENLSFKC